MARPCSFRRLTLPLLPSSRQVTSQGKKVALMPAGGPLGPAHLVGAPIKAGTSWIFIVDKVPLTVLCGGGGCLAVAVHAAQGT